MTNRIKGARMNPLARKEQILNTAINLAIEKGYRHLTRRDIAKRMQCASALINHYFDTIENLRRIVLATALEREILPIIAENFVSLGQETAKIPDELKQKVIRYLTN
jgi:AcrR family transcriptional regulator